MMTRGMLLAAVMLCLAFAGHVNGDSRTSDGTQPAKAARMQIVPDLQQRLERFKEVQMPFRADGLTQRQKQLVLKLVDASRCLEDIYWRQVDPEGLDLYKSLEGSSNPQDVELRRYLWINGSRFDFLENNKPFVGSTPKSPGAGFYPHGLTREQLEQYVKQYPEKKAELYSPTTIITRRGDRLEAVPYHVAYREFLEPAAADLREAADFSADEAFAKFLRMRADALLSDDYFPSDIAWLQLRHPKFDVIFAPYETYSDELMGIKATYGASVMIRDEAESRRMETFQKYVADIQDALPVPAEFRPSKRGLETPMEVVDVPFRTADLGHGYQAVADNLPNDPRVHEQKGSKKLFFKNFMDARVDYVIVPLSRFMMTDEQTGKVSEEGYLLGTIMHEICHGLGPDFTRSASGQRVSIREAIGPIYGGLEEAKADVVGMFALKWLIDHGVLPKDRLPEFYASYLAGNFRTLRFGGIEAHGQAEMMEFNYYVEHGAVRRLDSGKYVVDYEKMPAQIEALAKELLEIEGTGDRARAESWFKKYDVIPAELQASLAKAKSVPVDVDPVFSFGREVR